MIKSFRNVVISAFLLLFFSADIVICHKINLNQKDFYEKYKGIDYSYKQYIDSYNIRLRRYPESLKTIRPLSISEFLAIIIAIDFIKEESLENTGDEHSILISERYDELFMLLHNGRIKFDEDKAEKKMGTKMTVHIPDDPSDPFSGDIYVHESGLLENVYKPFSAILALKEKNLSNEFKLEKFNKYEANLKYGIILLSSYLIHETRHRKQKKFRFDPKRATESEIKKYLRDIEEPAYIDQNRFLIYLKRNTNDVKTKQMIGSMSEALVREVEKVFPGITGLTDE